MKQCTERAQDVPVAQMYLNIPYTASLQHIQVYGANVQEIYILNKF